MSVTDFDIITYKQFKALQKRHYENLKWEKGLDSYAVYVAIGNALGDKDYVEPFTDKSNEKTEEDVIKEYEKGVSSLFD